MMFTLLLVCVCAHAALGQSYYDSFLGTEITADAYAEAVDKNTTFWCTNTIEACDASEGRRIDGSCNNLNNPQRGAMHTPMYRLLPAAYADGFEPRLAASGKPLPLARKARTNLLAEGRVSGSHFTTVALNHLLILTTDCTSNHDTINYVHWRDCCAAGAEEDYLCTAVEIPEDDPVHRFSGLRCMNLTRPLSFQTEGCVDFNTTPSRINTNLPSLDLDVLYGITDAALLAKGRLLEGGLLKYELLNGKVWPPDYQTDLTICLLNRPELNETRCHDTPGVVNNVLIGANLMTILYWRFHNIIANALAEVNPTWTDDQLFEKARDINIAVYTQIIYYELSVQLMGEENLLNNNVISETSSFRDLYDESNPEMGLEFVAALRWFHTMQPGLLELTTEDGVIVDEVPAVNLTLRTGFLAVDDHLKQMYHGSFRQATAGSEDSIMDPDLAEIGIAELAQTFDIASADLTKGRYFGFAPYVDYLSMCTGASIQSYDDLEPYFQPQILTALKDTYEDVRDIDLMAGLWVENKIDGGYIPLTAACIFIDHLQKTVKFDRHWYERASRPNAFTEAQLAEVRKFTVASLYCAVADDVTEIQPSAFLMPSETNAIVRCDEIPSIDFSVWAETTTATEVVEQETTTATEAVEEETTTATEAVEEETTTVTKAVEKQTTTTTEAVEEQTTTTTETVKEDTTTATKAVEEDTTVTEEKQAKKENIFTKTTRNIKQFFGNIFQRYNLFQK